MCYPFQPHSPKSSEGYLDTFRSEWREVFFISAEIYVFGIIMYLLLGAGSKQPWADGVVKKKAERESVENGSLKSPG